MRNIIPDDLPEANRPLAERLATGAGPAPQDRAAIAILLRLPGLLAQLDRSRHVITYEIEGDDDRLMPAAGVLWHGLTAEVASGTIPATTADDAGVHVAALIAGPLGDYLTSMDEPLRRAVVEAVAHAAGVDLTAVAAPGDDSGVVAALAAAVDGHPVAGRLAPRCLRCAAGLCDGNCQDADGRDGPHAIHIWQWRTGLEYAHTSIGVPLRNLDELAAIDPDSIRWSSGMPVWARVDDQLVVRTRGGAR